MILFGVNGMGLTNDLWSFLLRWIGPTLYLRRTRMGPSIEGNGLELWRRLFTEYQGSDELIKLAGKTKLLDFGKCRSVKHLNHHLDEWLELVYKHGDDMSALLGGKGEARHIICVLQVLAPYLGPDTTPNAGDQVLA